MAKINITELQANENVGLSINTINANMHLLEGGVNKIEDFLDTTPLNGFLTVGGILVPQYGGGVNNVGLTIENSGLVKGNLEIQTDLIVGGKTTLRGVTEMENNLLVKHKAGTNSIATIHQALHVKSEMVLASFNTITSDTSGNVTAFDPKADTTNDGTNVLFIDGNATASSNFIKLGTGTLGQILFIKFVGNTGADTSIEILKDNFDTIYAANAASAIKVEANSAISELKKQVLQLLYTTAGWTLLNIISAPDVTVTF